MTRFTDHEARKREILTTAIEMYLNSAVPVSSESLLRARKTNLSSATVRNVFSELEELGYLTHPYTSAGRIPTDKGYRYYINSLMKKRRLKQDEVDYIDKIYELKVMERDDLIFKTSRIISDFTHYVSFVYFDDDDVEKVYYQGIRYLCEHPEFSDVKRVKMVLEALERKDELIDLINRSFDSHTEVFIGSECDNPQMEHCSVIVSKCTGEDLCESRFALIGPKRMAYENVIPLMDYISEAVERNLHRF